MKNGASAETVLHNWRDYGGERVERALRDAGLIDDAGRATLKAVDDAVVLLGAGLPPLLGER